MKALVVIYALGVIGMVGVALGYDRAKARKRIVRVVIGALAWPAIVPITFAFTAGKMLGEYARRDK